MELNKAIEQFHDPAFTGSYWNREKIKEVLNLARTLRGLVADEASLANLTLTETEEPPGAAL